MKTLTIKATVLNGHEYKWTFKEFKNENDYGNGIYIGIDRGEDTFSVDARYIRPYKFEEICFDVIREYYGANLVGCEVII